ncbi:2-deoxyglucose-6-phosphate phosphatase [Anaeramoeba flamelloides]|uniref:2-deoxyglucose-6-phosphate phosphatase n=1 Tax=Anaeramoeba flamelloides TaxID=1746091 RepID=A0AAV7ZTA4_9EUKA|nr:2-deoxyglucose-6-phosphate phosphatase [Anaeramoeba flamelloides]
MLDLHCSTKQKFLMSTKLKMLGKTMRDAVAIVLETHPVNLGLEEYLEEFNQRLYEVFPTCSEMPGAIRLVRHLHEAGIPIAVATGSSSKALFTKVEHRKWFKTCFGDKWVSGDHVQKSKPDPEGFLIAASKIGIKPENCLVFEDSPSGVQAAINGGMKVIQVNDIQQIIENSPKSDSLLNSLEEFVPEKWGLPPYETNK